MGLYLREICEMICDVLVAYRETHIRAFFRSMYTYILIHKAFDRGIFLGIRLLRFCFRSTKRFLVTKSAVRIEKLYSIF